MKRALIRVYLALGALKLEYGGFFYRLSLRGTCAVSVCYLHVTCMVHAWWCWVGLGGGVPRRLGSMMRKFRNGFAILVLLEHLLLQGQILSFSPIIFSIASDFSDYIKRTSLVSSISSYIVQFSENNAPLAQSNNPFAYLLSSHSTLTTHIQLLHLFQWTHTLPFK